MRVRDYQREGQDLDTMWGKYSSPYVVSSPLPTAKYSASQMQGRHMFRTQPRDLTVLPEDPIWYTEQPYDSAMRQRSSLVPDQPPQAHGVGGVFDDMSNGVKLALFLGAIGVAALLLRK